MSDYKTIYLSVLQEGDDLTFNLSGIDTALLYPLSVQLKAESYLRSLKVDFRQDRIDNGRFINPKTLNAELPSDVQLSLFNNSKITQNEKI